MRTACLHSAFFELAAAADALRHMTSIVIERHLLQLNVAGERTLNATVALVDAMSGRCVLAHHVFHVPLHAELLGGGCPRTYSEVK